MKVTTNESGNIVITTDFFGESSVLIDALKLYADTYYVKHHTPLEAGFNALPTFNENHWNMAEKMHDQVITEYTKDVVL